MSASIADALAFLLGSWSSESNAVTAAFPDCKTLKYTGVWTFTLTPAKMPLVSTASHAHVDLPDGGSKPITHSSGFLKPSPNGGFQYIVAHPNGVAEVSEGIVTTDDGVSQLVLDSVDLARVSTASEPHVQQIRRIFSVSDADPDTLTIEFQMATADKPLQRHRYGVFSRDPQ